MDYISTQKAAPHRYGRKKDHPWRVAREFNLMNRFL